MPSDTPALDLMVRRLIDNGLLIEAGFVSLRATCMHPDAPPEQLREMRMAFFAGAQHLFASMMQALDPDAEPTEADMRRVGLIAEELRRFGEAFTASLPVGGRA